ncbi:MAG: HD domain-containing protein [Deltaproteobacteria bacterium]|nr:HD domain-containing protein [Deltaproteobacteria bacterium]
MTHGKHTGLTRERALEVLHGCGFHLYHAKSWNESLFIHSFSAYALVDGVLPFTQAYSESDKELMRWAALLHDYGKTSANWQKALRGPHKVSLGDVKYEELKAILENGILTYSRDLLSVSDIDDILFIIEYHHGSGRAASTPARNRMKDVVSECDQAVSQTRISERLIRTLNSIIDTVRYRLFTVELIDHPMSALAIGAFDYVFAETQRIWPILYSASSTLYVAEVEAQLPSIEHVNVFLKEPLGESIGVLNYAGNDRIYKDEPGFLALASDPDRFVAEATAFANRYCEMKRSIAKRRPDLWSDDQEENFLYGRVCGFTYNTLLKSCGVPKSTLLPAALKAGGKPGPVTVKSLEIFGLRKPGAYEKTLRAILDLLLPFVREKLGKTQARAVGGDQPSFTYDVRDLLVPDSAVYTLPVPLDPKTEALADYERYKRKEPLDVCPACHQFSQGNVTAAAFPQNSPLGGTVEVFYTTHMRLIKKEGPTSRGVSFCVWCTKWWQLIGGNESLYRLCVMPHHLFARLDWREILEPQMGSPLVELGAVGTVSGGGVYPHIAVLSLKGRDRETLLQELTADPNRGEEQILDRLYRYGLNGSVIVTTPTDSRNLLTCGSIRVDTADWPILRRALRLVKRDEGRRLHTRSIRALRESPYAFGTLLAKRWIPPTSKSETEVTRMIEDIAAKTGLTFLADIWIGGRNGEDSASKVIRGMNETLRRLKGKEDDASLVDMMVAKGLNLAISTREGKWRSPANQPKEQAALRRTAEKLLQYKDQTYRRTEVVRAMIYTLAYFSKPETNPQTPDAAVAATAASDASEQGGMP